MCVGCVGTRAAREEGEGEGEFFWGSNPTTTRKATGMESLSPAPRTRQDRDYNGRYQDTQRYTLREDSIKMVMLTTPLEGRGCQRAAGECQPLHLGCYDVNLSGGQCCSNRHRPYKVRANCPKPPARWPIHSLRLFSSSFFLGATGVAMKNKVAPGFGSVRVRTRKGLTRGSKQLYH